MTRCKAKRKAAACCRQAARASASQTGKQFACTSHRRAATSLLDWSSKHIPGTSLLDWSEEIPVKSPCKAKQRGRRRQPVVGKQLVRVPARQANSLHASRTEEQQKACLIGMNDLHRCADARRCCRPLPPGMHTVRAAVDRGGPRLRSPRGNQGLTKLPREPVSRRHKARQACLLRSDPVGRTQQPRIGRARLPTPPLL